MDRQDSPRLKRRRLESTHANQHVLFQSVEQIQRGLDFRSSTSPEVKASVNRFKDFLSIITKSDDVLQQQKHLQILRGYCDLQAASSKEQVDFPDLLSAWSHAAESRNDPVSSAVPAALAQFFRAISGVLEFREFGLSLCYSLLKRDQLRLFDRGLAAPRTKEHLISPCLRLLTEVTSFDGGTMANHVFHHRDILFRRLESLLEPRQSNDEEDRRRPTVRRMALRLVIANLRFLNFDAKPDFLAQNRLFRAVTVGMSDDGDDIVLDILKAVDSGVVDDIEISRPTKIQFFTTELLSSIAALYSYEAESKYPDAALSVREAAHKLLLKICSTSKGISLSHSGWYPPGYDPNPPSGQDDHTIDLGLESPLYFDDYSTKLPVKNTTLAAFCQRLQPETDVLQAELLTQSFKQTSELVAEYFTKSSKLSITTDLDSQWRNRFAFLFSVVQALVPRNFGWRDGLPRFPPPISVVIESLLPRPLTGSTLTRFFTLDDEMLILSGSRLLSEALTKLGQVLSLFDTFRSTSIFWAQAYQRLVEAMLDRVPKHKDLMEAYQRCGKGNPLLMTALFECSAMYHKFLPEAVAGSKFDIGPILIENIQQIVEKRNSDESLDDLYEQLSWLIQVARLSPATKWWTKSGSDESTLYTTILGFIRANDNITSVPEMYVTLTLELSASGIASGSPHSVRAVFHSLITSRIFEPCQELYAFIDNSMHRAIQKPVRYLDIIESEQQLVSDTTSVSILACAVAEQWEFALRKHQSQKKVVKNISVWIAQYFDALEQVGENFRVLAHFKDNMLEVADEKSSDYLRSAFRKVTKWRTEIHKESIFTNGGATQHGPADTAAEKDTSKSSLDLNEVLGGVNLTAESLENVDHWDSKTDIGQAIQSGRIAKLIRCTSSSEAEIRVQAFHSLQTLAHVAEESPFTEKSQLYLLLGEICETLRRFGLSSPLPSVTGELGARLLYIVTNPAHNLFGKANKFLLRGPCWDIERLIPQWTDRILFTKPDSDEQNSWNEDVEWYISWLADGLKISADIEFYRCSGVFEKLLALYSSPASVRSTRKAILTVLWRAISVGGADTLITRSGLHEWLKVAVIQDPEHADVIRKLATSLAEASNDDVISAWKSRCPLLKRGGDE